MSRKSMYLLCVATGALWSVPGLAQTTETSEAESGGDIVVTAQRREERLKDVPIAISVMTGDGLTTAGIGSAKDLGLVTPGLNFAVQGAFAQPTIRGIGTSVTGNGADANVAIYIDGVYQPNQTANLFEFNNIERVEVLKGPQGTLFGRNATGGAIRIITRDPDQEARGEIGLGYGRFNQVKASGSFNAALSEQWAMNAAMMYRRDDGYVRNVASGNRIAKSDVFGARGKLKFDTGEGISFVLAGNYSVTDDNAPFAVHPIAGNNVNRQRGVVFPTGFYESALERDPFIKTTVYGGSLTGRFEAINGVITSITGFQKFEPHLFADIDNSPLFINSADIASNEKSFSQEVTYASNFSGPFNFVSGLFYYNNDSSTKRLIYAGTFTSPLVAVSVGVKTKAYSAFGEATMDLTDKLQLTGGIRYTHERKDALGGPGTAITLNAKSDWESWTPRVVLRYSPDSSSSLYASLSRGFKSGNYNTVSLSPIPVNPENVDALEVGYKHSSGGVSINSSAYYYKYENIQVQIQTNTNGVLATLLQNAASAEIYGADLEVNVPVSDSLRLQGGMAWTHARYDRFPGAIVTRPLVNSAGVPIGGNSQGPEDASGNSMIRTPGFAANLTGTYSAPLAGGKLDVSVTGSYNGSFYWDPGNLLKEDAYFLLNSRISWLSPQGTYRLSVYGENLTNEKYFFYVNNTQTGNSGAPARPWTVGTAVNFYF